MFFRCFNMAVKRKLAVKTLAEKCQALREKYAEKYGCQRTLF